MRRSGAVSVSGLAGDVLPGDVANPITFTIDLAGIDAPDGVVLHFDLLGFGALGSRVVIDDVRFGFADGTNRSPVAVGDARSLAEDGTLSIDVASLLSNDTDPDSDALTFTLVDTTQHGTLVDQGNGSFVYTPIANFFGTDTFTYRVNDGEVDSNLATVTLTVDGVNDAPTVVFGDPVRQVVDEGQSVVIGFTVSDVDGDVVDVTLAGAPEGATIVRSDAARGEFRWTATDGDATYPFEIVVGDDQAEVRTEAAVLVRNVAPVLTTEGEAIALSGQPYVLKFAAFDPGADTIRQWIVDWGDGSALQTAAGTAHELSHTFQQPGTRARIQVGAIDEDGAWSAATRTVDVVNDRLYVTNFTANDSGFSVRFSRTFVTEGINLYESAIVPLGGPDIDIRDAAGNLVRGSMVLDADRQGFRFVATDGALAAGRYLTTLYSRDNAFRDDLGRTLDGNRDNVSGDNYRTIFTVAPNTQPVITIAHTLVGPKQIANVAATERGIPITLTTPVAVSDIRFTLKYDPTKLTVAGLEGGKDLPPGSSFTVSGTPGNLAIRIITSSPVAAGSRELVRLIAAVPSTVPYRSAEVLDIGGVVVDGRSGKAADGVHVVAYLGDTTGDGRYTSLDAQRVARVQAGLDTGFNAYLTIDPKLIGDVNRDGTLTPTDGDIIVSETQFLLGGGINASLDQAQIPPIPATQQTAVLAAGGQPVTAPTAASQQQAQSKVQTTAARTTFGPNITGFNLAASMDRLNAMRLATPADELAERFLKGARTWADAEPQPTAEESWKVTLPTLTQGVKLSASVEAAAPGEGVLQALKYLVARKLGRRV